MLPAQQRFEAGDGVAVGIDDRLVNQAELVAPEPLCGSFSMLRRCMAWSVRAWLYSCQLFRPFSLA